MNGGIFMSLALMDEMLFTFYVLETFDNNSVYIDPRDVKIPSFDATLRDESNKPCFILPWLLDGE